MQPSWAVSCQMNDKIQLFGDYLHHQGDVKRLWSWSLKHWIHLTWLAAREHFIRLHILFVTCDIFFEYFTFLYLTLLFSRNFEWEFIFSHCDTFPGVFMLIHMC